MIHTEIGERDFSAAQPIGGVTFEAERFSHDVEGGPLEAVITAKGSTPALLDLLRRLRSPVILYSDQAADAVWWGYLAKVAGAVKAASGEARLIEIEANLEQMWNRAAVVYSYVAPGTSTVGIRATTAWAQHDASVGAYGYKERLISGAGMTPAAAEAARDTFLSIYQLPQARLYPTEIQSEQVTLTCKGWWNSLGWRQASRAAGVESHTATDTSQNLGDVAGNTKIETGFQLTGGEAWSAFNVSVKLAKMGSPADNVLLRLYSDSAGAPGTLLATATIAAADIGTGADWITEDLDTAVALALSTTYHLEVSRSGALDASNYYTVSVDEALGYASGTLKLWNGSAWVARSPDADLGFKVGGVEETTAQIARLADDWGQFISETKILQASGLFTSPYRDGDNPALEEILALLREGASTGKRLTAMVDASRRLLIDDEADYVTGQFTLNAAWELRNQIGGLIPAEECRVGMWVDLADVDPDLISGQFLASPSPVYIRQAIHNARTGITQYVARGQPGPWEILR